MQTYELTYIISSQIPLTDAETTAKSFESLIQSKEGVILKSDKVKAQTLSYPIKKQHSGYFTTMEFQTQESKVKEIKEALQKDTKVLRHFIIVKKPLKIMKERRTRKPIFVEEKPGLESVYVKKQEALKAEDIDKKLDEILNE